MNNLVVVCVFECVTDLDRDRDDAREVARTSLGKSWTRDKLHHEKWKATEFADVVNRDDVWVIECGGRACLANQTIARVGVLIRGREDFHGDFALELEIGSAIDGAHAAATELAVETVAIAQNCAGKRNSRA